MSNRNFDGRVIIQRLQNQVYARNLYQNNTTGQGLINNPQNTDSNASRFNSYVAGAQTEYFRGLIGNGETISPGGILAIPAVPAPVSVPVSAPVSNNINLVLDVPKAPLAPIIEGYTRFSSKVAEARRTQIFIQITQPTTINNTYPISNYMYSVDNGEYLAVSPRDTTNPISILFDQTFDDAAHTIRLKAVNSNGIISDASNEYIIPRYIPDAWLPEEWA
jgi:hypothetical protein